MYISLSKNPAMNGETISAWAGDCPPGSFYISWNFGSYDNPTNYNCVNTGSTAIAVTLTATVRDVNDLPIAGGTASATLTINPTPDTTPPTNNWAMTTSVDETGFTVISSWADSAGIRSVRVAVWTALNGQDDLVWHAATRDADNPVVFSARIPISAHNNESGLYYADSYATDNYGNECNAYGCGSATATVPAATVPVTGVSLNKTSLDLQVGSQETLVATVLPANATNKNVTWSSSNPTAVSVNVNGTVTANAEGWATITVTTQDGSKTATCTVTSSLVTPRPNNWDWSYSMYVGGAVQSTAISGSMIKAYIMSASEWNSFITRVNDFRRYKGLTNYSFSAASSEMDFGASIINQAVSAVNDIAPGVPSASSNGSMPNVLNTLRDKLNSIT